MIDQETYRQVVRYIASNRFPFPDQTNWPDNYVTLTNEAGQVRGIDIPHGQVYPEIVIIDGDGQVREGGVIEREVLPQMGSKWRAYSLAFDNRTGPPARSNSSCTFRRAWSSRRFRSWRPAGSHSLVCGPYQVVDGEIRITPVITPGDSQDHR